MEILWWRSAPFALRFSPAKVKPSVKAMEGEVRAGRTKIELFLTGFIESDKDEIVHFN